MKKMIFAATAAVALLAGTAESKPALTGGQLIDVCVSERPDAGAICGSFIAGVVTTLELQGVLCPPEGWLSTAGGFDMGEKVGRYMSDDPRRYNQDAARLVHEALEPTYGCGVPS